MGIIADRYKDMLRREDTRRPVRSNRASEIGHPCLGYLVHQRVNWDKAQQVPMSLRAIFREGEMLGALTITDLINMGIMPVKTEVSVFDRELNLSGTIDAILRIDVERVPAEIKSCNPYVFSAIDKAEDLLAAGKHYLRKWFYQCQAYAMMMKVKEILLIMRNKQTGEIKDLPVKGDERYYEEIAGRCKKINSCVARRVDPSELASPQEDICNSCPYNHLCLPPIIRDGEAEVINDPELEEAIATRQRLYQAYRAFKEADDLINKKLRGKKLVICGNYVIKGKTFQRKGYEVPPGEVWRKEILPLESLVNDQNI